MIIKLDNISELEAFLDGKKGIIFDMDGTILDSMRMWGTLDVQYLNELGIEPDDKFHDEVRTMTMLMAAEYIHDRYQIQYEPDEIVRQFKAHIDDYYKNILQLKPGVMELIQKLSSRGIHMMVATANEYDMCEAALERNGIMQYMDGLITCTMAGAGKERPDIYIKACEMMKISIEDSVVFEDSLFAIRTAQQAGFTVIAVYDETAADCWDEICNITEYQVVFEECQEKKS